MKALNSTKRLADLRAEMRARNLSAYMIPSTDAHNVSMAELWWDLSFVFDAKREEGR